jgi:hypothetical protein
VTVRRRTGNGAKFWLDGSASTARVAGVRPDKICHFRPPFLWFISFGGAKEMNNNKDLRMPFSLFRLTSLSWSGKSLPRFFWASKRTERSELDEAK